MMVIAIPMLVAQQRFSNTPWALPIALSLTAVFLLVGPFSFRALFPADRGLSYGWARFLAYVAVGGLSPLIAYVIPHGLGIRETFLATGPNLLVTTCLFYVGGFGLARDIEFESRWMRERDRAQTLAQEAQHAQLLALRAHLDPHFLFNTLNAIAEWCREDAEVAERAVLQLSSILREVLEGTKRASWPLSRELSLLRSLMELHQIRDPERFSIVWTVNDAHEVSVPPLILLPLGENAMKHGPGKGHRGEVRLRVSAEQDAVQVRLSNPGRFSGRREGGEGIPTIENRLALTYGPAARFTIDADLSNKEGPPRTIATVVLPSAGIPHKVSA